MATLANSLETIELGATAWRVIHNNNITKLDATLYRVRADSADTSSGFLDAKIQNSIVNDASAHKIHLSADTASPGANRAYGTSPSGVRAWIDHTMPSFRAHKGGTNQDGVVAASGVLVTMSNEDWDTNYNFNTTTSRFTPTVSGDYLLTGAVVASGMSAGTRGRLEIWKNAVVLLAGKWCRAYDADNAMGHDITALVNANGTTDFFELRYQHESLNNITVSGTANSTWFAGVRVR